MDDQIYIDFLFMVTANVVIALCIIFLAGAVSRFIASRLKRPDSLLESFGKALMKNSIIAFIGTVIVSIIMHTLLKV